VQTSLRRLRPARPYALDELLHAAFDPIEPLIELSEACLQEIEDLSFRAQAQSERGPLIPLGSG
jgi:hypothetical protein